MYKYVIEQWDNYSKKWFEVGYSNDKYAALKNIYDIKYQNNDIFYRLVKVVQIC